MDDDMGILEETAAEEYAALLLEDDADLDDLDDLDDSFGLDLEYGDDYGYEDYEPSPYDGTYSEE